jgi:hypothetical protein
MQSSGATMLAILVSLLSLGAVPSNKRTILTSGDKVFTIHYQLGQSTILYFGMKPETVICGNKNYFTIDKIKEGIAIQPLGNFSTNLTVMTQGRQFLFYLTPTNGAVSDTFVDVRWIPEQDSRQVANVGSRPKETVRELFGLITLGSLELRLRREIRVESVKRSILEFEVKNSGKQVVNAADIEVVMMSAARPLSHQISVFELDELKPRAATKGRLIVTGDSSKNAALVISYLGKNAKLQILRASH